jgi:hypothetical protein
LVFDVVGPRDELPFARGGPVRRTFGAYPAIDDKPFRVTDLVREGLAYCEMGAEGGKRVLPVEVEKFFFVLAVRLALVERDQYGDMRIEHLLHDNVVQFGVVIAEHVEIQGNLRSGQYILQDFMNIVAANEE